MQLEIRNRIFNNWSTTQKEKYYELKDMHKEKVINLGIGGLWSAIRGSDPSIDDHVEDGKFRPNEILNRSSREYNGNLTPAQVSALQEVLASFRAKRDLDELIRKGEI